MSSMEASRTLRLNAGISQDALVTASDRLQTFVWNVDAGRAALVTRHTIATPAEAHEIVDSPE